jgi:hypothetical protein
VAVIRVNYIKKGKQERAMAKAHIRYIQHRPGRSERTSMTHSTHTHCCQLAEMSNPEQLWYVQTYHDLDCQIYSPEYRLQYYTGGGWTAPDKTRNISRQIDRSAHNQAAFGDSKSGTASGRGKDGARISRTLFGPGGQMERKDAYEMIDQAEAGSTFFRVKICPDPVKEDATKDLLLREITMQTMALEEQLGTPVMWVAAIHADHTDKRHVHVLAVAKARLLPAQVMIHTATQACLEQRRELDLLREPQQAKAREGDEWERER